jgi:hypothetical protein
MMNNLACRCLLIATQKRLKGDNELARCYLLQVQQKKDISKKNALALQQRSHQQHHSNNSWFSNDHCSKF